MELVHLDFPGNAFLNRLLGQNGPFVQRGFRLLRLLIMVVHLVHKREVVQFKAVKGFKQSLVNLHELLSPGAVPKGQVVTGLGGISPHRENIVGVVLTLPALGPGINIPVLTSYNVKFLHF